VSKKISKDPLSREQRKSLKELHNNQITLEVILTIFVISILTINISSAIPTYGIVALLAIGLSSLLLFIFGVVITVNVSSMKHVGKPLSQYRKDIWRWLIIAWLCIPLCMLVVIVAVIAQNPDLAMLFIALFIGVMLGMLAAIVLSLMGINRIWQRFNKKRGRRARVITYSTIAFVMLILSLLGSYTTTEIIKYESTSVSDSNLELGQSEVKQAGKAGEKQIKHNLLFGIPISTSTTEPKDEIVAKGTRRYQYMYCSDGSYYYYTAEQFKDTRVGYTHQSADQCAQNGKGTQTTIADVPPAEKVVQQVPVYKAPTYTSPSYTTCRSYSFDNSFSCTTY
jgi:hypothetical protein